MYLTDEQAAEHDCIGPTNCGQVIDKDNKSRRVCKGSACVMAWRLVHGPLLFIKASEIENLPITIEPHNIIKLDAVPDGDLRNVVQPMQQKGYCGLAGDPHPLICHAPTLTKDTL